MRIVGFIGLSLIVLTIPVVRASAQGSGAVFTWSTNSITVKKDTTSDVTIAVSTGGKNTTGADIILDPEDGIEIAEVNFDTAKPYPQNFYSVQPDGTVKITSTHTVPGQGFSGTGSYVHLKVRGKTLGSFKLAYQCVQDSTADTNIMEEGTGSDIINCGGLTFLTVNVVEADSPSNPVSPTATPQSCSALASAPTELKAVAQSATSILLYWRKEPNANHYTLKYGTNASSYQYGAADIGNVDTFRVDYLNPNTTYYFALAGQNNCSTSTFITTSSATKTRAGGQGAGSSGRQSGSQSLGDETDAVLDENIPSFGTLLQNQNPVAIAASPFPELSDETFANAQDLTAAQGSQAEPTGRIAGILDNAGVLILGGVGVAIAAIIALILLAKKRKDREKEMQGYFEVASPVMASPIQPAVPTVSVPPVMPSQQPATEQPVMSPASQTPVVPQEKPGL